MSKCLFCKKSCYQLHNYCTTGSKQNWSKTVNLGWRTQWSLKVSIAMCRVGGCDLNTWFSMYRCLIWLHAGMCVLLHLAYIIIDEHTPEVYTHVSYQNAGQN